MALPIPALALGGAALLALLLASSSSKAAEPAPTPGGGGGAKPGTPALPGVPAGTDVNDPAMRKKIHDAALLLAQNGQDPDAMDQAATELEKYGFTTEAALLHARAAQLRSGKQPSQPPSPPPAPPRPATPDAPPPPPPPAPPVIPALTTPKFAVVTTNDPAPAGDLYIVPSPGAPGVPGVGAEKGGTVSVLDWNATPDYAKVAWAGGSRLGPVTGFAKKKFLTPSASAPLPEPNVVPVDVGMLAKVTTSSPSPDGDLIIRESMGGRQTGGALKDSLVKVLEWDAGSQGGFKWSKIEALTPAQNWPAVTGYAKQQYLKPQTQVSGMSRDIIAGNGKSATVLAQGGVRMWARAGGEGLLDILPYGTRLEIVKLIPGKKADPRAKGPGGWALVKRASPGSTSAHHTGWVPSETLAV